MTLFIGLMSGTSLDGIDGVLVDFGSTTGAAPCVRAHHHQAFGAALRAELLALNSPGDNELHRCELAGNAIAQCYASVVDSLLLASAIAASSIRAIGAHGQTVRHRPGEFDGIGYTSQILNAALLAELTGIDVIADLRRRDVAAAGQGAPLAPGLHAALFATQGQTQAVLNLGGIANLSVLGGDGSLLGFDTGPANALLDGWSQRHRQLPYDDGGRWAASGQPIESLLALLTAEPYFALPAPKSTGRDLFNLAWLDSKLARLGCEFAAVDVQATLATLTIGSVASALQRHAPDAVSLLVCGGGAYNTHLMQGLAARLPSLQVLATDSVGVPANQVEGVAFAWLAHRFVEREPGNLPSVTGALGPRVLGALHPA